MKYLNHDSWFLVLGSYVRGELWREYGIFELDGKQLHLSGQNKVGVISS